MKTKQTLMTLLVVVACCAGTVGAGAANGTWTNLSGGSWANAANWSGGTIADASGSTADFSTLNLGADVTITLDGTRTITTLKFDDLNLTKHNWTLNTGTTGPLTLAGTSPGFTVNSATTTVNTVIAGTAGLTKTGAGKLILAGANTYSGTTTVSAGTLGVGTVTYSGASPLSIAGSGVTESAGTLNLSVNGSATAVDIAGTGILRLTGTGNSATSPDIYFGPNHSGTSYYGARIDPTVDLGSVQRYIFGKTGHNGVSTYGLTACDCQFGGSIIGSGGLTFIAQMTYTAANPIEVPFALNGSNSFAGPVEIQRGSLYLGSTNALTRTNVLTLNTTINTNNARVFLYGNNITVADLSSSGIGTNLIANGNLASGAGVALSNATLTVIEKNGSTYFGSLVDMQAEYNKTGSLTQGPLGLTKLGTPMLTLAGPVSYTGPTVVGAGTLCISNTTASTLSGVISGSGMLSKDNTATLTLSNTNTYSGGTTLFAGGISIPNPFALGTGALTVNLPGASGTLTIANTTNVTLPNNIVFGSPGGGQTFNLVKNTSGQTTGTQLNLSGTISGGDGNTRLFLNSNTAGDNSTTYRFAGTNSFLVSRIELNRGGIIVVNPASLGDPSNLVYLDANNNSVLGDLRFENSMTFPNPIEFVFGGSTGINIDTNNVVLTGQVSGDTLLKLGSGKLTLTAPAVHTGSTTITAGTVALSGFGSLASTPVITLQNSTLDVSGVTPAPYVLSGQTLQGSGAILGSLQASVGTTLIPGGTTNVGTLSVAGNLLLGDWNTLNFDLGKIPASAGGTNNDRIAVAGNLAIGIGTVVNVNPIELALAGGVYKLVTYTGTLSGAGNTATWSVSGYTPSGRVTGVAISEATPGEIDLVVTGTPAPLAWKGDGALNAWDVQTTANWLNGATADVFYAFDNVSFTDAGSTSPAIDIQAAVAPTSVLVNSSKSYTFGSSVGQGITGGGTLTKSGSGTLTILNNNDYSGMTTVNNGMLVLGDGVSQDGSIASSPIVNNATVKFNVAFAETAGSISGSGVVVQTGAPYGSLTLNASNSWTGGLNILAGTTRPGVNYALPPGEKVTIADSAAYDFNGITHNNTSDRGNSFAIAGAGPDGVSGALVNNGGTVVQNASVSNLVLTADATVGGYGGRWDIGPSPNSMVNGQGHILTKAGSCMVNLRAQFVTNVAGILVNAGEMRLESFAQTNDWTVNTTNYIASGASLGSYGNTVNYPIVLNGGTIQSDNGTATWLGNVRFDPGSIFSTATGAQMFSGVVSGSGGLTVQGGTGSVTLSGANIYTGGSILNDGTLVAANANALSTGDVTINSGSLYFNFPTGTTNIIANNIALPLAAGSTSQQFLLQGTPTNFTTVRLTGVINGGDPSQTNRLTDTGVNANHFDVIVLENPANSFSGTIELWRGTLGFTSDAALGNPANTIRHYTENLNGSLRFDADNITLNAGRSIQLVSAKDMPVNVQGFHGTVAGPIWGIGNLIKQGTGTLTLASSTNTWSGSTTVSAGTLQVTGAIYTDANRSVAVTVNNDATLELATWAYGPSQSLGQLRFDAPSLVLSNNATIRVTGVTSGARTFTAPPGGTANLEAAAGARWTLLNDPAFPMANTSGNLNLIGAGTGQMDQVVPGNGALVKDGTGTWTLTAANTYTGPTTVKAGNLVVNGALGVGTVTVAAGASLSGSGTIAGPVTVNGTLAPGNSVGNLATGNETWNGGGSYLCELTNATTPGGWDTLNISGVLNLQATPTSKFTIKLATLTSAGNAGRMDGFTTNANYSWTIATASQGILNFDPNCFALDRSGFANDAGVGTFAVSANGNSLVVTYSGTATPPVPPTLSGFAAVSGGFALTFSGPSGQTYKVLSSTNVSLPLASWTVLSSGTFEAAPVSYTNSPLTDPLRFYRVASP